MPSPTPCAMSPPSTAGVAELVQYSQRIGRYRSRSWLKLADQLPLPRRNAIKARRGGFPYFIIS